MPTNPTEQIDAVVEARRPTQRALKTCVEWLHYCLQIGWPKSQIDALETLWWKYHDDNGRLITKHG